MYSPDANRAQSILGNFEVLIGLLLGLLPWGLGLIGVSINVLLGLVILTLAFCLVAHWFSIWPQVRKLHRAARISTILIAAFFYFSAIGRQGIAEYQKEHKQSANTADENEAAPNQAESTGKAPQKSKPTVVVGSGPSASEIADEVAKRLPSPKPEQPKKLEGTPKQPAAKETGLPAQAPFQWQKEPWKSQDGHPVIRVTFIADGFIEKNTGFFVICNRPCLGVMVHMVGFYKVPPLVGFANDPNAAGFVLTRSMEQRELLKFDVRSADTNPFEVIRIERILPSEIPLSMRQ